MIKNEIWYELKRKWYREKILKLLDFSAIRKLVSNIRFQGEHPVYCGIENSPSFKTFVGNHFIEIDLFTYRGSF